MALGGGESIAQRFAIDWVKEDTEGRLFAGDESQVREHLAYGQEVIAVAAGRIVVVQDGIPDNVPGDSRAVGMTTETLGGNYVLQDLGNERFAFYAHLQPGSVRVREGDQVARGQVLGLVGNSGNSQRPHLHFHVVDRDHALRGEGVPYLFDSLHVRLDPGMEWQSVVGILPEHGLAVQFPD
jgi:murein DD-endopeptidase MepM/ murein hydrolase activator NlpD